MRVDVRAQGFELTNALMEHTERRLRFALKHATDQVRQVTVRLADINGPRGGIDKRCSVHLVLDGLPDIVAEDTEADMYVAINRAVDRVGRTALRRMDH
ncbi:MAG TPA: HPF/RaiA family ribosome-associated protein [Noviherbaspirillum sp.]|uniref:HPF/RaiA family ribosome-associated protein n=1 Tax=Noviherbaspirillum sp. TaxID=1926288 RepID=UPI002B49469D|nr:HPF/RaiA family ribosome-associated protein [Noviherbaspirillum sp.]HJV83927.1 HPF/RaiA family ribosome-associated protein [Noviherbaspirillum sp.]